MRCPRQCGKLFATSIQQEAAKFHTYIHSLLISLDRSTLTLKCFTATLVCASFPFFRSSAKHENLHGRNSRPSHAQWQSIHMSRHEVHTCQHSSLDFACRCCCIRLTEMLWDQVCHAVVWTFSFLALRIRKTSTKSASLSWLACPCSLFFVS